MKSGRITYRVGVGSPAEDFFTQMTSKSMDVMATKSITFHAIFVVSQRCVVLNYTME